MSSSQYLTPAQAGARLNLTVGHLAQLRYTGKGPTFIKLGARSVRYRQSDLDVWVESSVRQRTDERPPAA